MALLLDDFGLLSVLLHGARLVAQSLTLGGIGFMALLARPLAAELGASGALILRRSRRLLGWSAAALAVVEALMIATQVAALADSIDLPLADLLGADFVLWDALAIVAALAILAIAVGGRIGGAGQAGLVLLALVLLAAAAGSSHAVARLDHRRTLAGLSALHQLAAGLWIGGIPYLLIALADCRDGLAWRRVGRRFSQLAMVSVLLLFGAGLAMSVAFIGSWAALYGTAYGIMVLAKVALFGGLLFLGAMNFRLVEALRRDPATPILRLRRFAEVEIGIGIAVFFAAAALTSAPPAIDLQRDRVTWSQIVERLTPAWPRLSSPEAGSLTLNRLQAELDAEAGSRDTAQRAFVPGAGLVPPRSAADMAWSEYNHHWAGILVLLMGLLALAEHSGRARWARHWPLLFLVMAAFLAIRADPEVWPSGRLGLLESLRDPEVLQHRLFVILIVLFALFEWRVRTGRVRSARAALVFPLISSAGGGLLLTHSHVLGNLRDQLLIEMTHIPLALLGTAAGWARWLELRLAPPASRVAGWVWPGCFVCVGLLLLFYRES